jgi:hypothetical protein
VLADCEFARFNQELFCDVAMNKTIAFIGDSISFAHYLSLTNLLHVPQNTPKVNPKTTRRISSVCNGKVTLVGQRDFSLTTVANVTASHQPDILVLNRGAHYVPDEQLVNDLQRRVFPEVQHWHGQTCRRKKCLLIWRTTAPGHPNCFNYAEPSNNETLAAMEQQIQSTANASYHWDAFSHQTDLVRAHIHNSSRLHWTIADVYPFLLLRPDAHRITGRDCLHYCAPGDEFFSELLLHLMRQHYVS